MSSFASQANYGYDRALKNNGKVICEDCKNVTLPTTQHTKGVTPSPLERQVDHITAYLSE